jgi:hypothetical protein
MLFGIRFNKNLTGNNLQVAGFRIRVFYRCMSKWEKWVRMFSCSHVNNGVEELWLKED